MTRPEPVWWRPLATVAAGLAVISFVSLHLVMASIVDPLRQPVSSYALTAPGDVLFAMGSFSLAAACLLAALFAPGLPRGDGLIRVLLAGSALMLVLVVVFRTDRSDAVLSISGEIHRWSAGVAFGMLTAVGAGWAWWGRGTVTGRWATVLTAVGAVALLAIVVTTFTPDLVAGRQWRGLPQRALLLVQTLWLAVLVAPTEQFRSATARRVVRPRTLTLGSTGELVR